MNKPRDMRLSGPVTKATVDEYIKGLGYVPLQLDGIPEGFCFMKVIERDVGAMFEAGYFVGFTPGAKWDQEGAVFYEPVMYPLRSERHVVNRATFDAKTKMLEDYKANKKLTNG